MKYIANKFHFDISTSLARITLSVFLIFTSNYLPVTFITLLWGLGIKKNISSFLIILSHVIVLQDIGLILTITALTLNTPFKLSLGSLLIKENTYKQSPLFVLLGAITVLVLFFNESSWSLFLVISFIPNIFWSFFKKSKKEEPYIIYYDANCIFCKKMGYAVRNALNLKKSHVVKAQTNPLIWEKMQKENSWILKSIDEEVFYGFKGLTKLIQSSYLSFLAPILNHPLITSFGEKVYQWIARNRSSLGALFKYSDLQEKHLKIHKFTRYTSLAVWTFYFLTYVQDFARS